MFIYVFPRLFHLLHNRNMSMCKPMMLCEE